MPVINPSVQKKNVIPDWDADAIFYQIFPERFSNGDPTNDPPATEPWGNPPTRDNFFGGDLQGILDKLDYLQGLGVNTLYLNPIFKAQTNHKYDTTDYFEVDPSFGNNDLFVALVAELHRRGMRIILDGVFNHCGDNFWAFKDVEINGKSSTYVDWFIIRSFPLTRNPLSYYTCGGAPYLPKLNHKNPQVQEYIYKIATYWLKEAAIDGWRLDVPCKIPIPFWQEFRKVVRDANPDAYLVGEIWRDAAPWIQGDTFDGVTNYRLRELILDYCATYTLDAEDFSYEIELLYKNLGSAAPAMLNLLGCHDTPRILTVFQGEVDRMLIALAFLFTTLGAPMVYYGDEVGLLGGTDPDCRRTMQWKEDLWNHRVYDAYRKLIDLRKRHPALRRGNFESLIAFERVFAYRRSLERDEVIIILNPGAAVENLVIPTNSAVEQWHDLVNEKEYLSVNGRLNLVHTPATSFTILAPVENDS
jgi:cyclomaltodextrinase / maltogenic alpha-amylase / neopullulanase